MKVGKPNWSEVDFSFIAVSSLGEQVGRFKCM